MYVSGTLKNKTIDFYREKVTSFDSSGIDTSEVYFSYNGELVFAPWDDDKEMKLISHEENHMNMLDEKIHNILSNKNKCGTDYVYFDSEIKKLISAIRSYDRRISFTLMETLYNCFNISNDRILTLTEFSKLLAYLRGRYLEFDQPRIDAIMYLFSVGHNYSEKSVNEFIIRRFGVDKNKLDTKESYNLYKLGEFVSPNRLVKVAKSIENEHSKYVLPIYFLIKDDRKAERFLLSCRNPYLDRDMAIKNAEELDVNENVISLVK